MGPNVALAVWRGRHIERKPVPTNAPHAPNHPLSTLRQPSLVAGIGRLKRRSELADGLPAEFPREFCQLLPGLPPLPREVRDNKAVLSKACEQVMRPENPQYLWYVRYIRQNAVCRPFLVLAETGTQAKVQGIAPMMHSLT